MVDKLGETKKDDLGYFLQLANNCCNESLEDLDGPLEYLGAIDSLYAAFIQDAGGIKPTTAGILIINAHASLRAAIRLAFSGQLLPVFMTLRGAIESVLYANAMAQKPELQDIWLARDSSEKARQVCRNEFTARKVFRLLTNAHDQDQEFSDRLREAYDTTIDFGAHPNNRSLLNSVRIESLETGEHSLSFTYIHGADSFELRQCIVACAEIGLSAFFVALICFDQHPQVITLNQRALELQDQFPQFVEQLSLLDGSDLE